ncbi:Cgl0159 family (beta/alpha)8-fold protein [Nonomuraea typhae]|uniref:Cgl0159 family (beta/alpha)8-fold protein n=1 Tax=Nonomuraea typhae TaxID=2603600 RepID=UPI001FE27F57|nr:deoxyribose-phosphate aldolase [Nonomuraea typhae]
MTDTALTGADRYEMLTRIRATRPEEIAHAAARRRRRELVADGERLLIIAADHAARATIGVRDRPFAMADRRDLLDRIQVALARPGVDGILASPDVLEDLLLLGALEGKLAFGSMNRGGIPGAVFEVDDRFTAYDAATIEAMRLDGGKMLCRIDPSDPATVTTLESCAHAVSDLARRRLVAMVEPFWSGRPVAGGPLRNDLSPEAIIRSISVGQALGTTSAYTWLKIPAIPDMERVMAATTLPALLLGGDPPDLDAAYADWARAMDLPGVRGLVVGRALLYPQGDDVATAVDNAATLVGKSAR